MNESVVQKDDIYSTAIKTICGHHKRSLLDFIDAMEQSLSDPKQIITKETLHEILGKVKARVHNDLSQCTLSVGVLYATICTGGNIKPFEENLLIKKDFNNYNNRQNFSSKR